VVVNLVAVVVSQVVVNLLAALQGVVQQVVAVAPISQ
jgi:hypothetical protein